MRTFVIIALSMLIGATYSMSGKLNRIEHQVNEVICVALELGD
jgi:hypothetical protein